MIGFTRPSKGEAPPAGPNNLIPGVGGPAAGSRDRNRGERLRVGDTAFRALK